MKLVTFLALVLLLECGTVRSKAISRKMSELEEELADMVADKHLHDASDHKPQTHNDKLQTYNDKPQTYNDKPQTYRDLMRELQTYSDGKALLPPVPMQDKPQTYSAKRQTYNDKPQTYDVSADKPQNYKNKRQTYDGLSPADEDLMKTAIEESKKEKKSMEGFISSKDDDSITKEVTADLPELMKGVPLTHMKREHSWGNGKTVVPDKLPPPPPPKADETKEKRMDALMTKLAKKLREMHKRGIKLPRNMVDLLTKYVAKKRSTKADKPQTYNDKPQTYNDKPQTYNDKPQTYDDKPQTYNDKPQTYNDKPQTYDDKPQTYDDKPQTYNGFPEAPNDEKAKPQTYNDARIPPRRHGERPDFPEAPNDEKDTPQTYNDAHIPPRRPGERPDFPEAPNDEKVERILMSRLARKLQDMSKRGMELPDKMVHIMAKYLIKRTAASKLRG